MQAARQVTDAAPIYQWRGSSDAWIDCDAAKYAEVGHGIANAKPGTYGSSWERRIVYASQQVQAGGEDKRYRIGAAWKRGGSAGYTRTSLPENARDGQYQLWAELIQPFTALSREQQQGDSNG